MTLVLISLATLLNSLILRGLALKIQKHDEEFTLQLKLIQDLNDVIKKTYFTK